MLLAAGPDNADLSEAIYRAYFVEGRDIGHAELATLAAEFGQPDLVRAASDEAVGKQLDIICRPATGCVLMASPSLCLPANMLSLARIFPNICCQPSTKPPHLTPSARLTPRGQTASARSSWTRVLQAGVRSSGFGIACCRMIL